MDDGMNVPMYLPTCLPCCISRIVYYINSTAIIHPIDQVDKNVFGTSSKCPRLCKHRNATCQPKRTEENTLDPMQSIHAPN